MNLDGKSNVNIIPRVPFHFGVKNSLAGAGALTPDNSRAPRKLAFANGSSTSFDPNQRRLPLQSQTSFSNYNSQMLNMAKKFSAPIDSLDQLKSYVANKK